MEQSVLVPNLSYENEISFTCKLNSFSNEWLCTRREPSDNSKVGYYNDKRLIIRPGVCWYAKTLIIIQWSSYLVYSDKLTNDKHPAHVIIYFVSSKKCWRFYRDMCNINFESANFWWPQKKKNKKKTVFSNLT